ncbi:hypothetical protein RVW00_000753 [Enterobacter bugandensis]|nr:hypothetical protein [Enterobacter bugandensis]
MKNGLSVDAPVTKEISVAVGWAIRAAALALVLSVLLYGVANLITAITPLIKVLGI